MIEKTIKLYTIDELSPKARERALQWWREVERLDVNESNEFIIEVMRANDYTFRDNGDMENV